MTFTYQKPFAPGMTAAERDCQSIRFDILQLNQKLPALIAAAEADPDRWNIGRLMARRKAIAEAEARLAQCEARIAAETAQGAL